MTARVYVLSYKNPDRATRMASRLERLNLSYSFPPPVEKEDIRIPAHLSDDIKRLFSCTWGHLDMIRQFAETDTDVEYGIFCEDDIHIRRDLPTLLPMLTAAYEAYGLDLLLLGYLSPFPLIQGVSQHRISIMGYNDQQWGAQMYMISRANARKFLDHFGGDYGLRSLDSANNLAPFSPDWTVTKFGNRALIYPMMAVEEGAIVGDHSVHVSFHAQCHVVNYDPSEYV